MAIKKTKPVLVPDLLVVPEGLRDLPTAVLLFHKTSGELWANSLFEKDFGVALTARFESKRNLGLIHERPVTLNIFSMIGRHEGFVLDRIDGIKVPIELRVNFYGDSQKEIYMILIEEVSHKVKLENDLIQKHLELQNAFQEIKRTQDALLQSAKLASIGELTSGIAHELNQPLQAIIGFSQELEHLEPLSPLGKEFIGDVIGAAKKMAEIIKSLRSFSRQSGDEFQETSILDAVQEAKKLTTHSLMQNDIQLEVDADQSCPTIKANAIQLEQVLVNLISNARDAITAAKPEHGLIKVKVQCTAKKVVVSVNDNGCGMSDETKQRIFDPFFTTKEVGQGTGLGLSISYGILKKLNAEIDVKSKINWGTTFSITFLRGKTT